MHALPIISPRCAIHTQNRSQFALLAPEIPERRRDASPLVFAIRPILSYIRISSGDGMSHQCGQCQLPDCPVSATDSAVPDTDPETEMVDQPFAASEIGESMDADLLPELSGETWVASALIEEFTADLLPAGVMLTLLLHPAKMKRWRKCGGGFSQNPLRHGQIVLDFLRNCAVGGHK